MANSLQAVPVAMAGRIYYWNMATFKKAGLDHYPTTEQELLDAAKTFQEKLGDDYYPLAAGPLDRMIMMTFYLESKYGEPWVTDSTLNYTVEQLQEGLEWIQSLEDNHVMPDLKTMNAAGDKTITDGQAWITGKYAGIFTWDSSALSASQNLPDDAEYVVGDEIKWGEAANGGFAKVSMGMAITQSCEHPVEAAALINFILNEKKGRFHHGHPVRHGLLQGRPGIRQGSRCCQRADSGSQHQGYGFLLTSRSTPATRALP